MNDNLLTEEKTNEIIQSLKALSQEEKNALFKSNVLTYPISKSEKIAMIKSEKIAMILLLAGADPYADVFPLCFAVGNRQFSVLNLAFTLGYKPSTEELDRLILAAVRSNDKYYFEKLYDMKDSWHRVPDLLLVAVRNFNSHVVLNAERFHPSQKELNEALDEATLLSKNLFVKAFSFCLLEKGAKLDSPFLLYKELSLRNYRFIRKLLQNKYIECDKNPCEILAEASKGRGKVLKELLEYGYKDYVNSFNEYSQTPLEIAVINKKYKAIKILLEYGADPENFINNPITRDIILKSPRRIRKLLDVKKEKNK